MTKSTEKRAPISDEQWLLLFQECSASGLSVRSWCELHQIKCRKYYYHLSRLRKKCFLPGPFTEKHEIVDVSSEVIPHQQEKGTASPGSWSDPAIRLVFHNVSMEIMNTAARECIYNTISVLQELC